MIVLSFFLELLHCWGCRIYRNPCDFGTAIAWSAERTGIRAVAGLGLPWD